MITAVTALVAVISGAVVTLYTTARQNRTSLEATRHQINATIVSASRQQWIDKLRDTIAEFQALLYEIHVRYSSASGTPVREDGNIERALFLRSRIALLVNPAEEDHRQLGILLDTALSISSTSGQDADRRLTELQHEITGTAQRVLKREWERVKRGEASSDTRVTRSDG